MGRGQEKEIGHKAVSVQILRGGRLNKKDYFGRIINDDGYWLHDRSQRN